MSRRLIAFLISGVAIVFAFGALTAIRWPSIMLFLGIFLHPDPSMGFDNINWRELGFAYGAPYFLAGLCFYASSISVAARRKGAVLWYLMACVATTPSFYLVDFEPGWWRDPSGPEGMVAGGSVIVILLGVAVVLLRDRKIKIAEGVEVDEDAASVHLSREQFDALMARTETKAPASDPARPERRRRGPMPAAIARQRAHFAAEGRRMMARRSR